MTLSDQQPRPVVESAEQQTLVVRIIAAAQMVLGGLPAFLLAFEWINWTAEQVSAYGVFLGIVVAAALFVMGQSVKTQALNVESQVTPVVSPRDDAGVPFVPIADDGLED